MKPLLALALVFAAGVGACRLPQRGVAQSGDPFVRAEAARERGELTLALCAFDEVDPADPRYAQARLQASEAEGLQAQLCQARIEASEARHTAAAASQEAGARLLLSVRSSDTVARLSGDEFIVILHDIEGRDEVGVVASKMVTRLAEPFDLDGNQAGVQASIGIAMFPDDADDAAMMIRLADRAMYAVKGAGKNNFAFHQLPERLIYPLDA